MKAGMTVQESFLILIFCLGTVNSLKCYKCVNRLGNCTKSETEVCKPYEDTCSTEIKQYHNLGAHTVKRGCSTANYCRRYQEGWKGLLHRSIYCCASDLCEPVSISEGVSGSQNGLWCQTCIGDPAECGQNAPSVPCYETNNGCVQISQRFLPGEQLEPIIKGCGNNEIQDNMAAYQIGKDFAYADQKSCGQPNCNNRNFSVILPGQPNGLQCYTCRDTGHGECTPGGLQLLNCTGEMNRCLHVMKKDNRTVTIYKGCATENICSNFFSIYYNYNLMPEDSFSECCQHSLCNQARGLSYREMTIWLTVLLSLAWVA